MTRLRGPNIALLIFCVFAGGLVLAIRIVEFNVANEVCTHTLRQVVGRVKQDRAHR